MTVPVRDRHVLIVGIDGVRHDTLTAADTPNLDRLAAAGFHAPVRVDGRNPTISGPVWATVASGVYSDKHGIRDNDLRGHRLAEFPDVLQRVRAAHPWAGTAAYAGWGQLVAAVHGGPIFAGGGYRPGLAEGAEDGDDLGVIAAIDEAVASRAARSLLHEDHSAVFAYLVLPDMVAHRQGVTPAYTDAVEICDQQVGVMLAAIAQRQNRASEEWTVIVVTDHGHLTEGGHGGESDAERTAWLTAAGPGIAPGRPVTIDHSDVHPHVLAVFDVPVEAGWGLEGVPFGGREAERP